MEKKPAAKIVASARPREGRFAAQYAVPGTVPVLLLDDSGVIRKFPDEPSAEHAAMRAAIDTFNARITKRTRSGGFLRLGGGELAALLSGARISIEDFADIAGVPERRVQMWISGEQDIPHGTHVLLRLIIEDERARARAIQITAESVAAE